MSAEVAAETVVEVLEGAVDTVVRVNVVKSFFAQKSTQIGIVALVAVGLGVATGWKIADKKLQAKYDEQLEREMEAAREFIYGQKLQLDKEGDFADPETALAALNPEAEVPAAVNTMKVDYSAMYKPGEEPRTAATRSEGDVNEFLQGQQAPVKEVSEETVVIQRKLFEEPDETTLDLHDAATQMLIEEGLPHVISVEDFNENDADWETVTITWFAGDSVLVDEQEQMINDVEGIVGESNMDRFGYLSQDNNVVYIKNPDKELLFEVVHSDGDYASEVLGLEHSDEPFQRRQRRSRLGD